MKRQTSKEKDALANLARIVMTGSERDARAMARKALRLLAKDPSFSDEAATLLNGAGIVRKNSSSPRDVDSRMELLKTTSTETEFAPVWPNEVESQLFAIVNERMKASRLLKEGLTPTRTALFVGEPGVGKSLAAGWLAEKLELPLFTLDLASVMSSYLGRTGSNVASVLRFANETPSVLFLDEFDAIAKQRGDKSDVGELKRLVNVVLQALDDWRYPGLLVAATNHAELLDRAIWRRFERQVDFPLPTSKELTQLGNEVFPRDTPESVIQILAAIPNSSFADFTRLAKLVRKDAILSGEALDIVLSRTLARSLNQMPKARKLKTAFALKRHGLSQRKVSEITGLSRDTLRKHSKEVS